MPRGAACLFLFSSFFFFSNLVTLECRTSVALDLHVGEGEAEGATNQYSIKTENN
jgi:hypothetical protein